MRKVLFIILLLLSFNAWSYELVLIESISSSKQTFITRQGKRTGVGLGKKATFTANNVSLIAKAIEVSGDFTQWEVTNDFLDLPFKKGEVVTYYDATEHLWALAPEETKRKYIKSQIYRPRRNISFHTGFIQGLKETVSDSPNNGIRAGMQVESYLESEINYNFKWAVGLRFARENINIDVGTLINDKFLAMADLRYYFNPIKKWYNTQIALALGAGYGQSQTNAEGATSSGYARVLPSSKIMANIPISNNYQFILETAFETITARESFGNGEKQETTTSSLRYGAALRWFF